LKNSDGSGSEVVIKSYNYTLEIVTVESKSTGETMNVPVSQLDFEEGEMHIVDWTSTVEAFKKNGSMQDDDGYAGK